MGKRLDWEIWDEGDSLKKGKVIGVVEDFNYKGLHNSVEDVVLQIDRTHSLTWYQEQGRETLIILLLLLKNSTVR